MVSHVSLPLAMRRTKIGTSAVDLPGSPVLFCGQARPAVLASEILSRLKVDGLGGDWEDGEFASIALYLFGFLEEC